LWLRERAAARAELSYGAADELWVTGERERRHFAALHPDLRVVVVPNGVEEVAGAPPPAAERADEMLLIAGFGWPPNAAAARALIVEILPLVRRRRPDASVTLIGRDLPPDLVSQANQAPVRWLGSVDDVRGHLRRAAAVVFAPPASAATGTPLKVSEALAGGTPLVATPVATEALGLRPGVHAVISNDVKELAGGVCRILEEPGFADALARAGREWARENLTTDAIAGRLRGFSVLAREAPRAVAAE